MMLPPSPETRISGIECFTPRNTPSRLTAVWRRQFSSVISRIDPPMPMPALLTRMSSRPSRALISAMTLSQAASSVTSWCRYQALPPALTMAATTWAPMSSCRSVTTAVAPSAASFSAQLRPMPLAAPVISATLP